MNKSDMAEPPSVAPKPVAPGVLAVPGEMFRRVYTFDWASTPLGPQTAWPQSLKTAVQMILASCFPGIVLWGADLLQIYNDGYRNLMDNRHPAGLGQPTRECWPEVWYINAPIYERVWQGDSVFVKEARYPIIRSGVQEDAWFTLSYSPIRDETDAVAGVLVAVFEMTERKKVEEALLESEAKYRAVFNSINEGFSLLEVLFDEHGEAQDILIRDANPAQNRIDGIRAHIGQRVSEFLPNLERKWIERYARIARNGEPEHFEDWSEANQRWYEVDASRIGGPDSPLVAIVYNDITNRKMSELTLKASEERKTLLLRLSDLLRPLRDPVAVQRAAMRIVARYLGVTRALYYELDADQDGFTKAAGFDIDPGRMPERMRLSDFGPEVTKAYRAGHTMVESDAETDPRFASHREVYRAINVRAWIGVPLLKNGQLVAILGIHHPQPRIWTSDEVLLLEEVAERTWAAAERAKAEAALRESVEALHRANETLEARVAESTVDLRDAFSRLEELLGERQALVARLVTAQEEERRRISRELHDQIGQLLTGFALDLKNLEDIVEKFCPPEVGARRRLERLRALAAEMGRDVHRVAVELRPTSLDDLGLVPALRVYTEEWGARFGVPIQFDEVSLGTDPSHRRLPPLTETVVYRVVQEALTNVARYAVPEGATHIAVTLQWVDGHVQVTIEDDGPGFDPHVAAHSERLGLVGMRERAELASGTLELETTSGGGTTVYLRVPVSSVGV
jgi:PAS domain S-box-containing protein